MQIDTGLTVHFEDTELYSLRKILDRATNTLEPSHWPAWLVTLDAKVDEKLRSAPLNTVAPKK